MSERVRRQKISGEVRRQLLDLIESGTVGPGEPLPSERELMERIGVGRPAIREAMQSLETIGLIEIRHGGGHGWRSLRSAEWSIRSASL